MKPSRVPAAFLVYAVALILARPADGQDPPPRLPAGQFKNPIELPIADPFVYRQGKTYYLYGTSNGAELRVWTSDDLVSWELKPAPAFRPAGESWSQERLWAPELFEHGGKYYLHFSACHGPDRKRDTPRVVLAEGDNPLGPFTEAKAPWLPTAGATLDSHVFRDVDGKLYLYVAHLDRPPDKHFEIHVRRLGADLVPHAESTEVLRPTQPWETLRERPQDALVAEAPFVVRRGDTYVMTWSGNPWFSPNYGVGVATAKSPMGPWEKWRDNPVLRRTDHLLGPGHQALVDSPDGRQWFMVYHVHRKLGRRLDRLLAIDRVRFGESGNAPITVDGPTHLPQPMPLAPR